MKLDALLAIATLPSCLAAVKVETGYCQSGNGFKFGAVPPPSRNDAATSAICTLVDGRRDGNGGAPTVLHDGLVPDQQDEPARNFFFGDGSNGGRIEVDLGRTVFIKSIHTYSWHPNARGPQVYKLYAAKGDEPGFVAAPKRDVDPLACGWKPVAKVDTRQSGRGGQHAAAVSDTAGLLGEYRHVLFDIENPDPGNPQANTFLSEIDVVDANGPAPEAATGSIVKTYQTPDGKYRYVADATIAPDLAPWMEKELMPVIIEWYPKMVSLLASDGFTPPETVKLEFRNDMGGTPAYAAGDKVSMNAPWFRTQLKGEAKGCVVHELVHVVQQYRRPGTPGWIIEGIPDYVRWFLYEPQSKGAEISKENFGRSNYDDSYRTSANFLNWVSLTHDPDFVKKLNAAAREGKYSAEIWKNATGKTVEELGAEWKAANAKRLGL